MLKQDWPAFHKSCPSPLLSNWCHGGKLQSTFFVADEQCELLLFWRWMKSVISNEMRWIHGMINVATALDHCNSSHFWSSVQTLLILTSTDDLFWMHWNPIVQSPGFGMCLFTKKGAQSFTSMRFLELWLFLFGLQHYLSKHNISLSTLFFRGQSLVASLGVTK